MLLLAIFNGYFGYVMINDNLAGSGNRIAYSICESIPFVGSYLASFIWGGQYPGTLWIHRFYIAHVLLISEGALRITPNWEWTGWGHTVPWEVFGPVVLFPLGEFLFMMAWPWLEGWFMRNQVTHHLLVAPRDRPIHTAIGAGFFTFNFVLFMASGDDVISKFFHLALNQTVWAFRAATVGVPVIIALITYRICKDPQHVPQRRKLRQPATVRMTESRAYVARIEAFTPNGDEAPLATPDVVLQSSDGD